MDEQYAFGGAKSGRSFSVLIDFFILFVESCAFLLLAVSVGRPRVFAVIFFALLVFDLAWTYVATKFLAGGADMAAQKSWSRVNCVAVGALAVLVALALIHKSHAHILWYAVPVVALCITAADCAFTWRFYAAAHIFDADSPYLDSDAVFAVKPSLLRRFVRDGERWSVENDVVLAPAS